MEFILKKTQTLIGSLISNILPNSTRRKGEKQERKCRMYHVQCIILKIVLTLSFLYIVNFILYIPTAYAVVDPLSVSNNKFGIHIISPSTEEASAAADLVNTNGNWGYITVLIESKDLEKEHWNSSLSKWQSFFNYLRNRHLIPIIRLATQPEGSYWKRPEEELAQKWAEFLDQLNWPAKNRYITIYNEPNHGKEWGNTVDPTTYAIALDTTITALKQKNADFFVMNAGFDASTPQEPPNYMDQWLFMQKMEETVPGIFNKLDGWVSHSYPNPGFIGSPNDTGRGTVRTWYWELQKLRELGVTKQLPIFITETGWRHSQGLKTDNSLPSPQTVAAYFTNAFENAWNNNKIVAVTPFLLNYQQEPFDHFSFKKATGEPQEHRVLGVQSSDQPDSPFHPHYLALQQLQKAQGNPVQEHKAELIKGEIFTTMVAGETYNINFTFKNTGQSIWNDQEIVTLTPLVGGKEFGLKEISIPLDKKVEPGQEYTFNFQIHAPEGGLYKTVFNLKNGDDLFYNKPLEFNTEIKSPVVLIIKSSLKWKDVAAGDYLLTISGAVSQTIKGIQLTTEGISSEVEARHLLPGYTFSFTLQKDYYQQKTIEQKVESGINVINFGTLEPDLFSALFNPITLWNLLPFSH